MELPKRQYYFLGPQNEQIWSRSEPILERLFGPNPFDSSISTVPKSLQMDSDLVRFGVPKNIIAALVTPF